LPCGGKERETKRKMKGGRKNVTWKENKKEMKNNVNVALERT
jgi:hypothetical protein